MDYNNIDEDDVEKLRLAALMTFKKKSNVPMNTISSTSGEFSQNKFANGNISYKNSVRNNRGRFPTSNNRAYNKRAYTNVGFRRPTHANNNLIAIIPTENEGDSLTNNVTTKNIPQINNSKHVQICGDTKSVGLQNLNSEVSTKFSRLENESVSEESEDSEAERDGKEESDDGDVLQLGEEDEDLDDLDKLMDIMEAEIAGGDVKISKKDKKNSKQKNKKEKSTDLKVKSKLNITTKIDEPLTMNQSKIVEDTKQKLSLPEEELESIKTLDEIRNSPSQCSLKSRVPLRSPSPLIRKRSVSPYSKLRKRSPLSRSPRRRSPTPDRYRYSPVRSRPYRRSLSPRRSPRRLSPLREKNLSPRRYSPSKSRYPYRSPSPRRRRRSLSRDISPNRRRLSPIRRRSRSPLKVKSKSRSPKVRLPIRRRSPSPLKKVTRTRPISPNIRRKDNKVLDDDYLKKRDKGKTIDKQIESKLIDPILEARKKKFESNRPIEPTSKKIILKKSNSVQVAIQTVNKDVKHEVNGSEINPKSTTYLSKKAKKLSPAFQAPKNISIKMNNDSETVNLRRVVKVNNSPERVNNKKRPRIVFEHDEVNEMLVPEDNQLDQIAEIKMKTNTNATKTTVHSETMEVSSSSEEELSEEEVSEESIEEESDKEEGQESCNSSEEYIEDDEDEITTMPQLVDDKKESLQRNDAIDLRTELKRRRALRLNMIQVEVKKKPESFYPARLLQSAIRGVVGTSSANEGKRKKHSKIPGISFKTEGNNSDSRRVVVMNRDKTKTDCFILPENQEDFNSEVESYSSVKRLKGKLKKVPARPRTTGVNHNNTIQKGLRKIIKRNINVTDFDQI